MTEEVEIRFFLLLRELIRVYYARVVSYGQQSGGGGGGSILYDTYGTTADGIRVDQRDW